MTEALNGRYELGPRLGAGGMAEVFAGYDRSLDRRVAVKFLKAGVGDPKARERFEREARAAASFTHPNAVTVFDVGEDGDRPYIVMELVEGRNLAELLEEIGPLPPDTAAGIADQMLAALGAAHARGLVHRDVKPSNVLVDRTGVAKLADFGIAKAVSDATGSMTVPGQVLGTPLYLAPEQAAGEKATSRSDIYSTGVVLYEMLAGAPPFTGDTPVAIALAHQQAPVPRFTDRIRASIPPELVATVDRAMEKDPARRFSDAESMRSALSGEPAATVMAPLPPTAPLPTAAVPSPPRRSRRPLVALLVAFAVVAALALLAFALGDGDGDGDTATPGADLTTTTAAPTTTTELPAPTTGAPESISELIARFGANPGAFGEKGFDLRDKLLEVQAEPDPKKASKLIEEIDKWVGEGELDPAIGAVAQGLLVPLASAPPVDQDNPGRGNGNGDDD